MEYRITAEELQQTLASWDALLPGRGKICLIACGGTALSLLGYKTSTKDVDFVVPDEREYSRLKKFLIQAGYAAVTAFGWKRPDDAIIYDLYAGQRVYQTTLVSSPLEPEGHRKLLEMKKLYIGVLNSLDLITTKLFRGTEQDMQDCLGLVQSEDVDLAALKRRYAETAQSDVSEARVLKHLDMFLARAEAAASGRKNRP